MIFKLTLQKVARRTILSIF